MHPPELILPFISVLAFVIVWVIVSIPVWLASKIVTRHSSFPRAMLATLASLIVFLIILGIFNALVFASGLHIPTLIGDIFGFLGVLGVFKVVFDTGWAGAFAIAVISFIIILITSMILALIGLSIAHFNI